MRMIKTFIAVAAFSGLAACAGGPRQYEAVLITPAADEAQYQKDLEQCAAMAGGAVVRKGAGRDVAVGAAAGAAAGAVAGAGVTAPAVVAGAVAPVVAVAAAVVVAPLVVAAGSYRRREAVERQVNERTSACLRSRGYDVAGFRLARK